MKVTIVRARAIDSAPYKLAETLSRHGLDVKLLVWDRQGDLNSNGGNSSYKIDRFSLRAPYDNVKVIFYLPFWYIYTFFYLLKDDADIIHANDIDTLWPAVLARLIKKNKLYYMIYDFNASTIRDGSPRFLFNALRKVSAFVEKSGIRFADTLFLTDENRFEEIKGAKIKKLVYVYNTPADIATEHLITPAKRDYAEIFYAGAITHDRGVDSMLKAIEDMDDVRLVVAGKDQMGLMKDLNGKLKEKVEYLGWISNDELYKRTMGTDILFRFGDPKYPKSRYESPNKVFEAMMSSKPIIVSTDTLASKIIGEENCGISVKYGDVAAIKEAISLLKDNSDLRLSLGANGRKAYDSKYSWAIMEKRLLEAYGVR